MNFENKKRVIFLVILFVGLLIVPMVSAGIFDWLKKSITGKASSSQPTNVSITISGVRSVNISVWNVTITGTDNDPSEENYTIIRFNVTVIDGDGANDINDSSVTARFQMSSQTTRVSVGACSLNSGQSTTYSKNYSCSVDMWYWDSFGTWTINVSANDYGNMTYMYNTTQFFQFDQLQAIKISPSLITWTSVSPGAVNQTATQFTTINNTGNYNITAGNIQINSTNLYNGANILAVANISGDVGSGTSSCLGMANLTNGAFIGITVANLTRGNLTEGGGVAQEQIYYCLRTVPSNLPSGTYDTTTAGSWTIKIV